MTETSITLSSLNVLHADRRLVSEALRRSVNMTEAAARLGITRHALRRRMKKYGWSLADLGGASTEAESG